MNDNQKVIDTYFNAFAVGDLEQLRDLFTDDVVFHEPGDHSLAGDFVGIEAVLGFFRSLGSVGNGTLRVVDLIDVVVGEHRAVSLMNTEAINDGVLYEAQVAEVFTFEAGRISDIRAHVYDIIAWNGAFEPRMADAK